MPGLKKPIDHIELQQGNSRLTFMGHWTSMREAETLG